MTRARCTPMRRIRAVLKWNISGEPPGKNDAAVSHRSSLLFCNACNRKIGVEMRTCNSENIEIARGRSRRVHSHLIFMIKSLEQYSRLINFVWRLLLLLLGPWSCEVTTTTKKILLRLNIRLLTLYYNSDRNKFFFVCLFPFGIFM